ncbi:hypothetical protein ACSIGC_02440 [Tenacibaculum sp. ZS6-P6]|uniref:hypothetical protein n=1 Tax=Tenacibaculum sp. ZS6-P6 TaxID=3447503 RepID=UPI003F9B2B3D
MKKEGYSRHIFLNLEPTKDALEFLKQSLDVYSYDSYVSNFLMDIIFQIDETKRNLDKNGNYYWPEENLIPYTYHSLYNQMNKALIISESQIMFAYKQFELCLKNLIKTFYRDDYNFNMYKWNNIIGFFETKNINLRELEGYDEVNSIRIINNQLKHNFDIINEQTESIAEFMNVEKDEVSYYELVHFYSRTKFYIPIFYSEICQKIENDLF